MLVLAAADTLAAGADAGTSLTSTVFGMESSTASGQVYKVLDQRQLASSPATIYTTPASTTAFVKSITVVNTDGAAAHTFQYFRGGTTSSKAITPVFTVPAGGSAIYEDGAGWSVSSIPAGTTLLNDIHTGYQDWSDIANPSAPSAGTVRMYARSIAGRSMPKWIPPSGLDNPVQPALFGNNVILWTPYSTTIVTPNGFGTIWAKGSGLGAVSTLTPSSTSPAIVNQQRRTRHADVITTANQAMGIISTAAGSPQFWRGNSAGLGGWFFFARFNIGLTASTSERLFVGLTAGAAEVVTSDTVANNTCGLWHDTTDGQSLYFVTRDASTTHKGTAIPSTTWAASQGYDFYMFAKPNDTTIYYRLDDVNAGTTLIDSSETNNLPVNTVFLGPQVEMSNGASDVTANTVAIDINRIYVESDH